MPLLRTRTRPASSSVDAMVEATVQSQLANLPLAHHIRVNRQAKRMKLIVRADGITLTLPVRVKAREVEQFLAAQQLWLHNTCARYAAVQQTHRADARNWQHGDQISFLGNTWSLALQGKNSIKRSRFEAKEPYLHFTLPDHLPMPEKDWEIKRHLKRWIDAELLKHATAQCQTHAATLGRSLGDVRIKTMRSQWGSCAHNGNINLNRLLGFAPKGCFDYVIAHECAHLKHPNHSPAFWACVEELMPHYNAPKHWLKTHGRYLQDPLGNPAKPC
jgi:predicted metal-dependent hydrolase